MLDGAEKIKMKGKHKYIFFICDNRRKKELANKIKDNIIIYNTYPKLNKSA